MASLGRTIGAVGMTLVGAFGLSACATEDYVDQHIATVNERINGVEARVQEASAAAQSAAGAAQTANQRIDQLSARVDGIEQQMMARKAPRN